MKKIARTSAALLIAFMIGSVAVAQISAAQDQNQTENMQEQSQEQNLKVECETGAYGQNTKCVAEGNQKQYQKQVLGSSTEVVVDGRKVHVPVNTALDFQTLAVAGGAMLTSAGAYAVKRRIA